MDFERTIQHLMRTLVDPVLVADELLKRWWRQEFSFHDQNKVSLFLIRAGLAPTLLNHIKKCLIQKSRLPWAAFLTLIENSNSKFSKEFFDQVLIGAAEENALEELIYARAIDRLDLRFKNLRKKMGISEFAPDRNQTPPSLKSVPAPSEMGDQEIRDLLMKKAGVDNDELLGENSTPDDPLVRAAMVERAEKSPNEAYEISVSLFQMGCFSEAIHALQFAEESEGKDWLHIELLVQNQLFLDALNALQHIEMKYAQDPSSTSSALVYKARALWGLNEKAKAVALLESLISQNPSHVQARFYLRDWKA